jgi:hypothetical protein
MPTFTLTTAFLLMAAALTFAVLCLLPLRDVFPRTAASTGLLWLVTLAMWLLVHTVILAINGRAMAINLSRHFVNVSTFTYADQPDLFIGSILFYAVMASTLIVVGCRRLVPGIRGRGNWP